MPGGDAVLETGSGLRTLAFLTIPVNSLFSYSRPLSLEDALQENRGLSALPLLSPQLPSVRCSLRVCGMNHEQKLRCCSPILSRLKFQRIFWFEWISAPSSAKAGDS